MALPLLPLALKGLAVAGAGAAGSGAGYGISKILPEDNFFSRWWNRTETDKTKKRLELVRRRSEDSRRKTMAMFEDMGIKTDDLIDANGQVDQTKLDEAYAQARQKIKERGGNDLPEDATLADLHKAYRASDPARNPLTAKTTQKAAAQGAGPRNGTLQKQPGKDPPLTRRGARAPADPTVTPVRKPTTSGVVAVDGVPDLHQTETRGKLEAAVRNKASVLESNSNTVRKDAASAERRADAVRGSQELRDRMERADDFDSWRSQRNERIRQERADTRYRNRTLSNREDWENLGREGSNRRDYTRKAEGETDEQFNAAVADRNSRLAALRRRMAEMTDTSLVKKDETTRYNADTGRMEVVGADGKVVMDAGERRTTGVGDDGLSYANRAYANAPGRMRQAQEIKKLMESAGDNITDAQMEAIGKGLDKWQGESDARVANQQVRQKLRDTEQVWRLRREYGMESSAFSDDAVRKFHERSQKSEREKILRDMDVAPGQGDEAGRADRMSKNADNWMRLVKTGFDVDGTFRKAMADPVNTAAYQEGVNSIAKDDPERADKLDQLRRRFVMNQAMADAGLKDKVLTGGDGSDEMMKPQGPNGARRGPSLGQAMARDLPGSQSATGMAAAGVIQTPNIVDALRARQTAQGPGEDEARLVESYTRREQARRNLPDVVNLQPQPPYGPPSRPQVSQPFDNQQPVDQLPADQLPATSARSGSGEIAHYAADGTYLGSDMPDGSYKSPVPLKKKKPEETQQAAKGGDALRPRRRR